MSARAYTVPHGEDGAGLRAYLPSTAAAPGGRGPRWLLAALLLALAYGLGFCQGAQLLAAAPAITFIQPRVPIVIAPPTGTVIPVQIRIEPHAANRAYAITWCSGAHGHSLDGAADAAIQPDAEPLQVRVAPGDCPFLAQVFGAGGAERARASFVMHVCGGQDEPCVPGGTTK